METSLHRALKDRYSAGEPDRREVRVAGFRIDAVDQTGRFVEIQATAEKDAFSAAQYGALVALAAEAMRTLFARQREAIEKARA